MKKLPKFIQIGKRVIVEHENYGTKEGVIARIYVDNISVVVEDDLIGSLTEYYLYCDPYDYGKTWVAYEVV